MLITQEPTDKRIQFRLRISESVLNEINEYCQWAGIHVRDYFIEQACKYIFEHDKEWENYK